MIKKLKPYFGAIIVGIVIAVSVNMYMGYTPDTPDEQTTPVNTAKIILPEELEIEIGELGVLDATKSNGVSFIWHCIPEGLNVQVYANGRKLMFSSSRVGRYTCIVSSAYNDDVDQKLVIVTVHPVGYDPDNPNPKPPTPVPDNGTLASKIPLWAVSVSSMGKVTEAKALAAAFDRVAVQIEAGTLVTADDVQDATRRATEGALGGAQAQWKSFLNNLQDYLKVEKRRGTLVTVEDHVRVWREISSALKTVRS